MYTFTKLKAFGSTVDVQEAIDNVSDACNLFGKLEKLFH